MTLEDSYLYDTIANNANGMSLTQAQRHQVYKNVRGYLFQGQGMCTAFENALGFPLFEKDILKHFPELAPFKPKKLYNDFYWFPLTDDGYKSRLNVLDAVILNTAP